MKNIDITKVFKKILFLIVVTLIVVSIISIFFVVFHAAKLSLQLNYEGLINFLELFIQFSALYASMVVSLSAYVAIESLNNHKIVEEGKAVLELKKLFNTIELQEVSKNLRPITGKWNNDNLPQINGLRDVWPQVEAYIGVFVFANHLIDSKVISFQTFQDHFGYSFDCLVENDKIRLMLRIGEGNNNFKELCDKMNIDLKTYKPKWNLNEQD